MTDTGWQDRECIRRLAQLYARAVDARDYDALEPLFFADGVVIGARGKQVAAEYIATARGTPASFASSMHVLADPLIDLEPTHQSGATSDPRRARSDTYAVVYQIGAADGTGDMTLGLRYLDELEHDGTDWRIRHRTARIVWTKRG